jgi:hypothetical protein
MMKRCSVVLFLFLACAGLSAQTADCASLTHQALDLSGFNQSIDHLTAIMASDDFMQQFRGRESAEEFLTVFKPILMKQFNPALLRQEMQSRVTSHCNAEQMAETVSRLQSPLVARMLALETATNTPEGQEKLKRYINIAKTVPPTDDRIEALDVVDASSGASDFATDTIMAVMRGMMTGVGAPPDVITQFQAHRKDLKAQMQTNTELSMSVIYHGVTRPELLQYAREVGAPPLKGFYALVNKSFVELIEERSLAIGQELKKTIVAHKD